MADCDKATSSTLATSGLLKSSSVQLKTSDLLKCAGGGGAAAGYALDDSHHIATTPFIHWDASQIMGTTSPTWSSATTYSAGDWVTYLGAEYVALQTTINNIPSSGAPNWQAADGNTFSTWTSREGSNYDLVQSVGGEQFTYEAASSNMNSKPVAISSDGMRYMMTATDFLPAGTVTMPITVILAYHEATPTKNKTRFGGKNTAGDNVNHFRDKMRDIFGAIKEHIYMNVGGGTGGYISGPATQTGAHVITWELDNTATPHFYYELARTLCVGTASANDPFNYQFTLGAANTGGDDSPAGTEFAEVLIFNEILSDTEMSGSDVSGGQLYTIITYLKTKYGIL